MMKKIISLVLVVGMCLLLFACKKEDTNDEAKAATAPVLDLDAYKAAKKEDPEQAADEYEGQLYRFTGTVIKINDDYCVLGYEQFNPIFDMHQTYYEMKIYLNKKALNKLEIGSEYTFAGRLEAGKDYPILQDAILIEE